MATRICTINGVEVEVLLSSIRLTDVINGVSSLSIEVLSPSGTYRPALRVPLVLTEDGDPIFSGLIHTTDEAGSDGPAPDAITTRVDAKGYGRYAEQVYVTSAATSATLEAFLLAEIEPLLTGFGLSLDPAQITGPTLDIPAYDNRQLASVLRELVDLASEADNAAYFYKFHPDLTFGVYTVGTLPAPVDLIEGDGVEAGDVSVERTHDHYADVVSMLIGRAGLFEKSDSFTGNGVQTVYTLTYPMVTYTTILVNGIDHETIGTPADPAMWTFDRTTNTITRNIGAVPNGQSISIIYNTTFPLLVTAGSGPIVVRLTNPDLTDLPTATLLVSRELAKRQSPYVLVRYPTRALAIMAGQTQVIESTKRGLASPIDAVIKEVSIAWDVNNDGLVRTVVASKDGLDLRPWIETAGGGAGVDSTSSSAPEAAPIVGTPGPAGSNGSNGTNGTNGSDGADGADGSVIHAIGSLTGGVPDDSVGQDGDWAVYTPGNRFYGPKASGTWVGCGTYKFSEGGLNDTFNPTSVTSVVVLEGCIQSAT